MKVSTFLSIIFFFSSIVTTFWGGCFPHLQEAEFRAAFERGDKILTESKRNGFDTSHLAEAFTQNAIDIIEREFTVEKEMIRKEKLTYIAGEETTAIAWVDVIEYTPPEAIVEVRYYYRTYEYNLQTGVIKYFNRPNRYWRTFKYRMRQEDGIWKVDKALEFVDWSG